MSIFSKTPEQKATERLESYKEGIKRLAYYGADKICVAIQNAMLENYPEPLGINDTVDKMNNALEATLKFIANNAHTSDEFSDEEIECQKK